MIKDEYSPRRKVAVNVLIVLVCWLAFIGAASLLGAAAFYFTH